MSEVVEEKGVDVSEDTATVDKVMTEAAPEQVKLPKFETAEEKMVAMEEIKMLQSAIDTVYHMPKYDQGNKGRAARKITGSVPLNFFPAEMLQKWGNKLMELTERL